MMNQQPQFRGALPAQPDRPPQETPAGEAPSAPPANPPSNPNRFAARPRRSRASFLSYHARRCSICRHPDRDSIDGDFLHWTPIASIAQTYRLDRRALYRHAHATGLFRGRNRGLRFALGHIIEQAQSVEVTADSIVRAVRLFACLNDQGEWVAPPPRSAPVFQSVQTPSQGAPARSARSTHPANLNTSQVVGNKGPVRLQIDTNSHP
jgi:hypothetical protein